MTDPPPYRYLRSAYTYQGELRRAILSFKMESQIVRAAPLACLLLATEQMGIDWEGYDLIVPVPLHNNRLRRRGYNQCSLLVSQIARTRKIEWTDQALVRTRDTTPQFMVERKDRRKNVKGAFDCPEPAAVNQLSILLVDDITTTGSTLAECAKVLKEAGASVVDGAVLARPISENEALR
jgi:ComF family protein